jgi:hypothetical protein
VCVISDHRNSGHEEVMVDDAGSVKRVDCFCYLGDVMGGWGWSGG